MRQADVFRQVIVSAQAQTGDDIEVGIARRQENDGQRRRQRAQFAAQRKTAVDIVGQANIDQREIGKPSAKRDQRVASPAIRCNIVTMPAERIGDVVA